MPQSTKQVPCDHENILVGGKGAEVTNLHAWIIKSLKCQTVVRVLILLQQVKKACLGKLTARSRAASAILWRAQKSLPGKGIACAKALRRRLASSKGQWGQRNHWRWTWPSTPATSAMETEEKRLGQHDMRNSVTAQSSSSKHKGILSQAPKGKGFNTRTIWLWRKH